jgi:hypothetical protein
MLILPDPNEIPAWILFVEWRERLAALNKGIPSLHDSCTYLREIGRKNLVEAALLVTQDIRRERWRNEGGYSVPLSFDFFESVDSLWETVRD